jgi:hypothetical protein
VTLNSRLTAAELEAGLAARLSADNAASLHGLLAQQQVTETQMAGCTP